MNPLLVRLLNFRDVQGWDDSALAKDMMNYKLVWPVALLSVLLKGREELNLEMEIDLQHYFFLKE